MKKLFPILVSALALSISASLSSAAHHEGDHEEEPAKKGMNMAPKSVIHVVTVSWNEDASEADIKAALKGVHTLGKEYDGIKRVWTKTVKAQGDKTHAFVMEFKNKKALADYSGSDAQKNWYKVYIDARGGSTTFDISN
ncbi:MAG: Dabb family protein [Verrucomicrobiia bacterium]|tara:strand:+ start:1563 stop:1979 length:417 start_codon:yes stop_codon:yes gene_type:complete